MTVPSRAIIDKLNELEEELKKEGLWKIEVPGRVYKAEGKIMESEDGFAEWLQFVFLPGQLSTTIKATADDNKKGILHAIKFFGNNAQKGKLLQILIEIDSIV